MLLICSKLLLLHSGIDLKICTWYNIDLESFKSNSTSHSIQRAACLYDSSGFNSHFDTKSVNVAVKNRVHFFALKIEALDCDNNIGLRHQLATYICLSSAS